MCVCTRGWVGSQHSHPHGHPHGATHGADAVDWESQVRGRISPQGWNTSLGEVALRRSCSQPVAVQTYQAEVGCCLILVVLSAGTEMPARPMCLPISQS